jgi:hypothetical protein
MLMDLGRYGPFANVVAVASALVATFSILILKAIGGVKRWTWLTAGTPSFLVTAAARVLAVALIAITYVTISKANYIWFGAGAVLTGALALGTIIRFDRLRRHHVVAIPLSGPDGQQLRTRWKKQPRFENLVVGLEKDLRPDAEAALAEARKTRGGVSLQKFMSGFGTPVNDPGALWDSTMLADISSRLTTMLVFIVLLSVMALFWAAFAVEVSSR